MHKPRLGRLELLYTDCPVYFLTVCTAGRRAILANEEVHKGFVSFAGNAPRTGVWVGRYVIMPDHLHLFAAFRPGGSTLSEWIKSLKNSLSKALRVSGVPGPHWQKGFFDHVMRSKESYSEKWEYVRRNPVRVGLVEKIDEWGYQGEIHRLSAEGMKANTRRS